MVVPLWPARRCRARWPCGAPAAARSRRASWSSWSACRSRRRLRSTTRGCSTRRSASLERQTATAEVLQVISGSMADPKPVFDRILSSAKELFDADARGIYLVGDDGLVHAAAVLGEFKERIEALFPIPLEGSATELSIERGPRDELPRRGPRRGRTRPGCATWPGASGNYALAQAPMMWEGRGIGAINVARRTCAPFSEKESRLLETFADQAVIAIQNARLFNETKEALERRRPRPRCCASSAARRPTRSRCSTRSRESAAAAVRTARPRCAPSSADGLRRRGEQLAPRTTSSTAPRSMPIDRDKPRRPGRARVPARLQIADTRAPMPPPTPADRRRLRVPRGRLGAAAAGRRGHRRHLACRHRNRAPFATSRWRCWPPSPTRP